jgi:hypothetical protein
MPDHHNEHLHDMHQLMQEFENLNALHQPDRLEFGLQDFKDAVKAGGKKVTDTYKSAEEAVSKKVTETSQSYKGLATDQEVIEYYFLQDPEHQAQYITMLLDKVNLPDLVKMMLQSSAMKKAIMFAWHPGGIDDTTRKRVYDEMHPVKPKK